MLAGAFSVSDIPLPPWDLRSRAEVGGSCPGMTLTKSPLLGGDYDVLY